MLHVALLCNIVTGSGTLCTAWMSLGVMNNSASSLELHRLCKNFNIFTVWEEKYASWLCVC
jgi:hypothetical protein